MEYEQGVILNDLEWPWMA